MGRLAELIAGAGSTYHGDETQDLTGTLAAAPRSVRKAADFQHDAFGSQSHLPIAGRRRGVGAAFLDSSGAGKKLSSGEFLITQPVSKSAAQRGTAFGGGKGGEGEAHVFDRLPETKLWTIRVILGSLAAACYASSLRLDSQIKERASRTLDQRRPVSSRMIQTETVEVPAGRRRANLRAGTIDEDGVRVVNDRVTRYDPVMMTKPFWNFRRTIMDDEMLWMMQYQLVAVAAAVSLVIVESTHSLKPVIFHLITDLLETDHAINRLSMFAKIVGTFNAFFLGQFTGKTLSAYDGIWEKGFLKISQGTSKVSALLQFDLPAQWVEEQTVNGQLVQFTKTKTEILDTVSRWSRASVSLLFRQYGCSESVAEALTRARAAQLLTDDEQQLLSDSEAPGVAIWTWHHQLLAKLKKDGLANADHAAATWDCWTGAFYVSQKMRFQIPYQFLHLITAIVKASNVMSVGVAGLQVGRALLVQDEVEAVLDMASHLMLPLINNSILVFNINLSNPMSPHFTSWSEEQFDADVDMYADAMVQAESVQPRAMVHTWKKQETRPEDVG
eukprot:TRINITY_DN3422_c0_g1_i1.p1 TRINITY_DN3422_c0_g1~~TRINITY_DN3422_c0_g1_i1.p1  ORF type:complete len:557 (+),score=89.99 TRINITY_DN3422_c0_g1_i1:53-1723(+)